MVALLLLVPYIGQLIIRKMATNSIFRNQKHAEDAVLFAIETLLVWYCTETYIGFVATLVGVTLISHLPTTIRDAITGYYEGNDINYETDNKCAISMAIATIIPNREWHTTCLLYTSRCV